MLLSTLAIAVESVTLMAHAGHDTISGFPSQIRHAPALDRRRMTTPPRCGGELLPNTTKFLNNFKSVKNIQQLKASKALVKLGYVFLR
jgi:hypothetical protein